MTASVARAVAPRGFRNFNPGNIRKGNDWQGLAPNGLDPEFDVFVSAEMGFRALCRILLNYRRKHGLRTIGQIISRWAPPNENDTPGYIRFAAVSCGVQPDAEYELNRQNLFLLAKAIARKENGRRPDGGDWFSDAQVLAGVDLALGA
ncbi:MAG: structural protein [Methylobacterium sp.]|nr:structural protein [Methylobacterium sp.]